MFVPTRLPSPTERSVTGRPQAISRLVYEVEEAMRERTQEVRVEASDDGGRTYRQILVQEYNFSPRGATFQREDQRFDLRSGSRLARHTDRREPWYELRNGTVVRIRGCLGERYRRKWSQRVAIRINMSGR